MLHFQCKAHAHQQHSTTDAALRMHTGVIIASEFMFQIRAQSNTIPRLIVRVISTYSHEIGRVVTEAPQDFLIAMKL